MRDKINQIIGEFLSHINIYDENWEVNYGYDFVEVALIFNELDRSISPTTVISLGKELDTDLSWIRVEDNHLVMGFDISNIIIKEFGVWENYDAYYEYHNIIVEV